MNSTQLDHKSHHVIDQQYPISLLAHDIDSPANIGSIFRIADALGIEKLYLTGSSAIPPNSKLNKAARSTDKYVRYEYDASPLSVIDTLKKQGYRIISLEITSASIPVNDFSGEPDKGLCLILGSERTGVSQALLDASELSLHIPMLGHNSSMNVANACAIAVYEMTKIYR